MRQFDKGMVQLERMEGILPLILANQIFSGVSEDNILSAISSPAVKTARFRQGEAIFSAEINRGFLGMIIEGTACVEKILPSGQRVFMSRQSPGDIFGVLAMFSQAEDFPTIIRAQGACAAIFIPHDTIRRMYYREPRLSENLISYLASRVLFLNRKITSLAAVTADDKLAAWLTDNIESRGGQFFVSLPLSMTDLASSLGVGRASLYRAFDRLTAEGIISKTARKIAILKPHALAAPHGAE